AAAGWGAGWREGCGAGAGAGCGRGCWGWTSAGGGVGSSSRPNSTSNNVRVVRSCAVALETSTPDRSTRTMARTQAWKTDIPLFSPDRPAPKAAGSKNGGAVVTGVEVFFPFIG